MEATLYNQEGKSAGKLSVPADVFGLPWNADLVHEVVRLMNSNARTPIAHTKTRGEVRGGGKKPWKQKGTGRARHGSSRSPIWVGGGVTHGPRNDKNFTRKINKKTKMKALFTVLSRKFRDGEILFVDSLKIAAPKTKDAKMILSSLSKIKGFENLSAKKSNAAIIAMDAKSEAVSKSFNNIGSISVEEFRNINPVSLLNHSLLVVSNPETSLKMWDAKASANVSSDASKTAKPKVVKEKKAAAKK